MGPYTPMIFQEYAFLDKPAQSAVQGQILYSDIDAHKVPGQKYPE